MTTDESRSPTYRTRLSRKKSPAEGPPGSSVDASSFLRYELSDWPRLLSWPRLDHWFEGARNETRRGGAPVGGPGLLPTGAI